MLVRMLVGMVFCGLGRMVLRVQCMAVGGVGMMRRLLVIAALMMLGGGAVVLGRVFMVLRGFVMVIDMVFGHGILS
jgi:hypothetical protein